MALDATSLLLVRLWPSSRILHVVYLNTIVFTYHVKHVTMSSYFLCERLQSQGKHLHHNAFISTRSYQISGTSKQMTSLGVHRTRPSSHDHGASQYSAMKVGTRCSTSERTVNHSTTLQILGTYNAVFKASVPIHTTHKAIQGVNIESSEVVSELKRPKPPEPQQIDQPRMISKSGNTVPWQCLFTLFCDQTHASTLYVVFTLDAQPLLLGCPRQPPRRVDPAWYLNTSVFTYHKESVTNSSLPLFKSFQEQVKLVQAQTHLSRTIASTSTRRHWKPRCACKTRSATRMPPRSLPSQDDAYTEDASTESNNGKNIPRLLCPKISRKLLPKMHSTVTHPLESFGEQINWVHGAYLPQQRSLRFVFDTGDLAMAHFWRNEELLQGNFVQESYQIHNLHKYEEHSFNKREAGTLHSQVGEGDAFLPSRKTAIFLDSLTSRIEPLNYNGYLSFGSEIAISSNFLHPSMRSRSSSVTWSSSSNALHAFFNQDGIQQRTRSTRSSSQVWSLQLNACHAFFHQQARTMTSDAFFPKDPLDDRMNAFYLKSEKISSINGKDSAFNVRIYFEFKFKFKSCN